MNATLMCHSRLEIKVILLAESVGDLAVHFLSPSFNHFNKALPTILFKVAVHLWKCWCWATISVYAEIFVF